MKKVLVLGSPGSGKSVFSRKLHDITGLPLFHLDMLWHTPEKTTVPVEEFDKTLRRILNEDVWIIDGNYLRTFPERGIEADTIFVFDLPTEVCLRGIHERIGCERPDFPWREVEIDPEFVDYVRRYRDTKRPMVMHWVEICRPWAAVHIFQSRRESEQYLEGLEEKKAEQDAK